MRSELNQLLMTISADWQRNESDFEARALADWPKWCDDQGYGFELLRDYGMALAASLPSPDDMPGLLELIASADQATTTAQLIATIHDAYPDLLDLLEQDLSSREHEVEAIGSLAGGTGHETLTHSAEGVGVVLFLGAIGWGIKKCLTPAPPPLPLHGLKGPKAQEAASSFIENHGYRNRSGPALRRAEEGLDRLDERINDQVRSDVNRAERFARANKPQVLRDVRLKETDGKVVREAVEYKTAGLRTVREVGEELEEDAVSEINSDIASYADSVLVDETERFKSSIYSSMLEGGKARIAQEVDEVEIKVENMVLEEIREGIASDIDEEVKAGDAIFEI